MLDVIKRNSLPTTMVADAVAPEFSESGVVSSSRNLPPPQPDADAADGATISVPLPALFEFWPDTIRLEIAQAGLNEASIALPVKRLESSLKMGCATFTWGQLIRWLVPAASFSSPNLETTLDLPMKAIVPLFMAQCPPCPGQKKIVVNNSIPDLFQAPDKSARATAPMPIPAANGRVPSAPATNGNGLGEILGQIDKKEWVPQEIAEKIKGMDGVAGALLVKNDGLLVAGSFPPQFKSETFAAFIPQNFTRLAQLASEAKLGALSSINLFVGLSRCAVFKVGTSYLAVLGKGNAALPEVALQRLAVELAKHPL